MTNSFPCAIDLHSVEITDAAQANLEAALKESGRRFCPLDDDALLVLVWSLIYRANAAFLISMWQR